MSQIDAIFREYIDEHRGGGEADPRAFLARVEGADRLALAALIDAYLKRAPGEPWDPEKFPGSAAERTTSAIAAGWDGEGAEREDWALLLPALRNRARLLRRDVVARLADAIGAGGQAEKVAAYYHQMEVGKLPSEGVSNRVLEALAAILGESAETLRRAGSAVAAGGDEGEAMARAAFARKTVRDPRYAGEVPGAAPSGEPESAEAEPEPDAVDELFTGGPGAG